MQTLIIIHGMSTIFMVGLIWFVQLVHYPLFSSAERSSFRYFEQEHSKRTSFVVMPPMLLELGSSIGLFFVSSERIVPTLEKTAGLTLVIFIWLSTFLLQVPQHIKLRNGFNEKAHRMLVNTNWIRTALWSLRGILATIWIVRL